MKHIFTITSKELRDNIRDRRSVFNALFSVLFNPILYIFLFGFINRSFAEQAERPLHIPIIGGENSPSLVAYLEQHEVIILPAPSNPETALREGNISVVLRIPADFGETFETGQPSPIQLMIDDSNDGASVAVRRTRRLLEQYSNQIGSMRLVARGISPQILNAIPIETVDVAPRTQSGAGIAILNMLPVIMTTAAFFGGFYLVVDMMAGERERESLEPLLLNPVPRWQILLGKYITALLFTTLATFLATALYLVLLRIPQIQDFTNIRVSLGFDVVVTAVLLMIPVVIMAVALEMLVATFARTVKEAQTYTQLIAMFGFLPSIFLSVLPVTAQPWMNYIPTVAQLFLIGKVSRGEPVEVASVAVASIITIAIGAIAFIAALQLFNRERIILGK